MAGVFEFALAEWGYPYARVQAELTDEQFVLYLDAATERVDRDFRNRVEAVRMGVAFAHHPTAYDAWIHRTEPREGLSGASLEAHVASVQLSRPDLVKVMVA